MRFDRRGIGDSSGRNGGWRQCRDDIVAARTALQQIAPHIRSISGLGLCDGAAALLCAAQDAQLTGLILINPWLDAQDDGQAHMLPALLRQRYWQRLRTPRHWWRLLRGQIDGAKLRAGLQALRQGPATMIADPHFAAAWAHFAGPRLLLLSAQDAIAQACTLWLKQAPPCAGPLQSLTLQDADHSLSRPGNIAAAARAVCAFMQEQRRL